jgi:hypothetical protein
MVNIEVSRSPVTGPERNLRHFPPRSGQLVPDEQVGVIDANKLSLRHAERLARIRGVNFQILHLDFKECPQRRPAAAAEAALFTDCEHPWGCRLGSEVKGSRNGKIPEGHL